MIKKGVGLVYSYCRSVECYLPSSALSTSFRRRIEGEKNSKFKGLNKDFRDEDRRNYEDTFGNIGKFETIFERVKDDPEDIKEYQREREAKRKGVDEYIKEIKSHLRNFDYDSALKLVEIDMVNDMKQAHPFAYRILISYNAKIGNLAEAYRLYVNYKKRQGRVTGAMYTSLFNACANCEHAFYALEKAAALNECIRKDEDHVINLSNYNSMMKAYGRHGDIASCLKLMDEILYKKDKVCRSSFVFLLQACISDKNSGLRYALLVWRKMLQNRVRPSIHLFHSILKCTSECSLGDADLIPNLIEEIVQESGKFFGRKVHFERVNNKTKRIVTKIPRDGSDLITPVEEKLFTQQDETIKCNLTDVYNEVSKELDEPFSENSDLLSNNLLTEGPQPLNSEPNQLYLNENTGDSSKFIDILSDGGSNLVIKEQGQSYLEDGVLPHECELPNLLALKPSTGSVIKFGVMTKPHFRFLLLGGMKGFLKTMAEFRVHPDVQIFTMMLDVIPSTLEAEQELLSLAKKHGVTLDTLFFNLLMKKRFMRDEDSSARDCLEEMYKRNLQPNLLTFGILAIGCRTCKSGMDLVRNVKNHGFRVNDEILCTLLSRASFAGDKNYVHAILKVAKEDDVKLSQKFVARLSGFFRKEKYRRKKEKETVALEDDSSY